MVCSVRQALLHDGMVGACFPRNSAAMPATPVVYVPAAHTSQSLEVCALCVAAATLTTALQEVLPQLVGQVAEKVAEKVAEQMCRVLRVPASDCKSSQWEEIVEQLPALVLLDLNRAAPCCCESRCLPVHVPAHPWSAPREDDVINIKAALAFLRGVLPPDVIAVPVQGIKWLSANFCLTQIKLIISHSKTDYLLIYKPAWDALMGTLGIHLIDGYKVSNTVGLRDHLPSLLTYILGFYEVGACVHDGYWCLDLSPKASSDLLSRKNSSQ